MKKTKDIDIIQTLKIKIINTMKIHYLKTLISNSIFIIDLQFKCTPIRKINKFVSKVKHPINKRKVPALA